MKIMVIKEKKGLFINPKKVNHEVSIDEQYKTVDLITKEDILDILDYWIDDDIEMDPYDQNELPNPAQATIYNSLYAHFEKIKINKEQIKKEVDDVFSEEEKKYCM